jgi:putative spermidine/putrescine transport system ATP-binding protein
VGAHAQEETESGDVHCTLVAAHHLGRTIIMRLRSRDGTEITLHRPPVHTMRDLQPGRTGLVAWQARNAIAFPMDEKSR